MNRLNVVTSALILMGYTSFSAAEMPERPLPPAPMEQMGAPVDCDPTLRSADPRNGVNRDCPTQPQRHRGGDQNRTEPQKGKPPTLDPDNSGRELDPR